MKTIEKTCLWRKITISAVFLLLSVTTLFADIHTGKTPDAMCDRLKVVLQEDLIPSGKLSCDSAVLFLPSKDADNAFIQAHNLCNKFGALPSEKGEVSQTYLLPDKKSKLTLLMYPHDKNVYAIFYLGISCNDIKLKEVRYVSLKAYRDIKIKTK